MKLSEALALYPESPVGLYGAHDHIACDTASVLACEVRRLREYEQRAFAQEAQLVKCARALNLSDAAIARWKIEFDKLSDEYAKAVDERISINAKREGLLTASERLKNVMASHHTPGRVGIGELMNKQGEALWDAFCAAIEAAR